MDLLSNEAAQRQSDESPNVTRRLLFDVTGLIHWYAFHAHPSGIQRVTEKLLGSAPVRESGQVEFVARALGGDTFYRIDRGLLGDPARLRVVFARTMRGSRPRSLLADLRWYHLPYVGLASPSPCCRRSRRAAARAAGHAVQSRRSLVAAAVRSVYARLKARTGVRVVQMIHDLFVLDQPNWFAPRFASDFTCLSEARAGRRSLAHQLESYVKAESLPPGSAARRRHARSRFC